MPASTSRDLTLSSSNEEPETIDPDDYQHHIRSPPARALIASFAKRLADNTSSDDETAATASARAKKRKGSFQVHNTFAPASGSTPAATLKASVQPKPRLLAAMPPPPLPLKSNAPSNALKAPRQPAKVPSVGFTKAFAPSATPKKPIEEKKTRAETPLVVAKAFEPVHKPGPKGKGIEKPLSRAVHDLPKKREEETPVKVSVKGKEKALVRAVHDVPLRRDREETPIRALRPVKAFNTFAPSPKAIRDEAPAPRSIPLKRTLETPPRPDAFFRAGSPTKPLDSVPPSERAARLLVGVKPQVKLEGAKPLSESLPTLSLPGEGEDDAGPDQWSPRKSRKGHLFGGLASRASALVAQSRSEHTIWLHKQSRAIAACASDASTSQLARALQPAIRLQVLETFPLGRDESRTNIRIWEESKIALARCRLLLADVDEDEDISASPVTPDLEGLVLFSLHSHPPAGTTARALAKTPVSPPRKRLKGDAEKSSGILLPTNPHDLRLVKEGSEIWVFEDWHQVTLRDVSDLLVPQAERALKREVIQAKDEEELVAYDTRPEGERAREEKQKEEEEKEAARSRKALVCSKFGFLV